MQSTYLFQQRIDCVTQRHILQKIRTAVTHQKKLVLFAMNTHILSELKADVTFQKIHHSLASIIFADGMPLVWLSKLTPHPLPARVNGTELVERVLADSTLKIFLVGSTTPILKKMAQKYPSVSGYFAPPFGAAWNPQVDQRILHEIKKRKPDVLMVGVSPLRQEKWLAKHHSRLTIPVRMAVGSAFDILSGATPRAPKLMQKSSLEWVWRLWLEPQRLGPRYVRVIVVMIRLMLQTGIDLMGRRIFRTQRMG